MSQLALAEGLFLYPTPLGCYYAVSSAEMDKSRKFLMTLLMESTTPKLTAENLMRLMDEEDETKALDLLYHCQKVGWVQGVKNEIHPPTESLETILPDLLAQSCESGKILLADDEGFYLCSNGFPHEVAEELSALSAEISNVHKRRSGLLINNMGLGSHAWAVVDAFGNSKTGFWPLFIGQTRFFIIVSGIPHFNQPEFVTLVWVLATRYAK